jgi:hypothetical protein
LLEQPDMPDSSTVDPSVPRSLPHDAVDGALQALCAAHRGLAAAPADFLSRSGLLTPPLAALDHWQQALLRTEYFTLIAANRFAGAMTAHALADARRRKPPRR